MFQHAALGKTMTTVIDPSPYFPTKEGFCRPDWEAISVLIEKHVPEPEWNSAWEAISRQWVDRLCQQLGGRYRVHETSNFLILTEASDRIVHDASKSYEGALQDIRQSLRDIAGDDGFGKHVVLMFADLRDYCRYIAYFYPEGEHPMSGGVCLSGDGYVHFAFPTLDYTSYSATLVHELTHGFLAHLPIPTWLNEALALRMEEILCGSHILKMDRDLHERHARHWNTESIQSFWKGQSWDHPGDGFELSYSLAQILWHKIEVDIRASPKQIIRFVSLADAADAGESACRDALGTSLGDLVRDFLGEGEWTPTPGKGPDQAV